MKCLTALKFYQTQSNTIKQGVQTKKCLMTKQCLIVFDRQTFPVWRGLKKLSRDKLSRDKKLSWDKKFSRDKKLSQDNIITG